MPNPAAKNSYYLKKEKTFSIINILRKTTPVKAFKLTSTALADGCPISNLEKSNLSWQT